MVLSCNVFQDFSLSVFFSQTALGYFYHEKVVLCQFTHQLRCYHLFIVDIIVESVNLIQMSADVRIEQKCIITMMDNI